MKVAHPGDPESLEGGIKSSIQNQRLMMKKEDIEFTKSFNSDIDVLHLNILGPADIYRYFKAQLNNIPVVIHTHEIGENFKESFRFSTLLSPLVRIYVDFFYKRADLLICPSEYAAETLSKRGIDTKKTVISNGLESSRLEGYQELENSKEKMVVVNLSLPFERKGLTDFIEVAKELPEIQFKWYGPHLNSLLSSSKTNKLLKNPPKNVEFPGFADDVRKVFTEADIFFFPTKSETEGLSVFEAAYCETPVLIRDIDVYKNRFTNKENCLKAESQEEFINQIKTLERNPKLRSKLSKNGKKVSEKLTVENLSEKLSKAYKTAIEEKN